MELPALALILAAVFVWALFAGRATAISAPIFFVAIGIVLAEGLQVLRLQPDPEATKVMAEVTLAWVLFADASRVRVSTLRHDAGLYARLLGVGLPLTIVGGALLGAGLLGLSPWYALLVGAALAPTDAALGSTVMSDRRVPYRIRQTLNVESGMNDGIATPVVTTAIAAIAIESGATAHHGGLGVSVLGLLVGAVTGIVLGALGGTGLRHAGRRGWAPEELAGPAVLVLSLLAYVAAVLLGANGFVAAFVAGIAFGSTAGRGGEREVYFVEQTCGLASMVCWLFFGAVAVPALAADWSWRIALYAVLSLTLVRMAPVALALIGTGLGARSVLFIGWFGPRGLASVVFALLAMEELEVRGPLGDVVATIGLTVLLSVFLHGLTAHPLVSRVAARQPSGQQVGSADASSAPASSASVSPVTGQSAEVIVRRLLSRPRSRD